MRFIFLLVYFLAGFFCVYIFALESGTFVSSGPRNKKAVSLTFDDGPGPDTIEILKILEKYEVKATFFMQGSRVETYPEIVKKVFENGQEIGSHLFSHTNFARYKKDDKEEFLKSRIEKTHKLIYDITGINPRLLRMPHGYVRSWVKDIAKDKNYMLVNWTFGCDWKKNTIDELVSKYTKNIRPGAILLMHDSNKNCKNLIKALPNIIEEIKKKDYEIIPVGKLIGL